MAVRYAGRSLTNIADARAHALLHGHDLVDDLVLPQVPGEAALAGRAEGAPHGAADLHAQPLPSAQEVHRVGQPTCVGGCLQAGTGAGKDREERAVIPKAPYVLHDACQVLPADSDPGGAALLHFMLNHPTKRQRSNVHDPTAALGLQTTKGARPRISTDGR